MKKYPTLQTSYDPENNYQPINTVLRVKDFACQMEFATWLYSAAMQYVNMLSNGSDRYPYLMDDMKYLSFRMFHQTDWSSVKLTLRKRANEDPELGIYVGNEDDYHFLYVILGKEAKEVLEEAIKREAAKTARD